MHDLSYDELIRRLAFSERQRSRMRRAAAETAGEDDGTQWSIADLMTLLLIFFILLYAQAGTQNPTSVRSAAVTPSNPRVVSQKIVMPSEPTRVSPVRRETAAPERSPAPAVGGQPPFSPSTSAPVINPLQQKVDAFMKSNAGQGISVRWKEKRPIFILNEKITFLTGQADLLTEFQPTLVRIATFIAEQKSQRVLVTGHTDDTPIGTYQFPSNWELSASRAASVARFLITHGVDAGSIAIQGNASYRPIAPNDTLAHKQANRRVEIALIE